MLQPDTCHVWVLNRMVPNLVVVLLATEYVFPGVGIHLEGFPYDTLCLLILWLWCGWLMFAEEVPAPARRRVNEGVFLDGQLEPSPLHAPQLIELRADVGSSH
jgi:hypothetical protein